MFVFRCRTGGIGHFTLTKTLPHFSSCSKFSSASDPNVTSCLLLAKFVGWGTLDRLLTSVNLALSRSVPIFLFFVFFCRFSDSDRSFLKSDSKWAPMLPNCKSFLIGNGHSGPHVGSRKKPTALDRPKTGFSNRNNQKITLYSSP